MNTNTCEITGFVRLHGRAYACPTGPESDLGYTPTLCDTLTGLVDSAFPSRHVRNGCRMSSSNCHSCLSHPTGCFFKGHPLLCRTASGGDATPSGDISHADDDRSISPRMYKQEHLFRSHGIIETSAESVRPKALCSTDQTIGNSQ